MPPIVVDPADLDANMVRLIAVLNRIPGLTTCACCGGHRRPKLGQASHGEWFVDFDLTKDARGWRALTLLGFLSTEMPPPGWVELLVWGEGLPQDGHSTRFDLHAYRGVDPDAFAALIESHLPPAPHHHQEYPT